MGGGAVGAELTQVFARFGARVSVVEALPRLLPSDEPEAGRLSAGVYERAGVAVHVGTRAERVSHDGSQFTVNLADDETLTGQRLLVATGRRADLPALRGERLQDRRERSAIGTDERMQAAEGSGPSATSPAGAP